MAAPESSETKPADHNSTDGDICTGPGIVVFDRRERWMKKIKTILNFLFVGSVEEEHWKLAKPPGNGGRVTGKQLSSIEIDPDDEVIAYVDLARSTPKRGIGRGCDNFKHCFGEKGYVFLVTCVEIVALLYLISTSVVIFTKDLMCSWFFQPFLAPLWLRHPTALLSSVCIFCLIGFAVVLSLMAALDDARRSANLMLPHLILQILVIFLTFMFSLIAVILLVTKGTFTLRIFELATSSVGDGLVGIGNIVLGLEQGRLTNVAADDVLINAGITWRPEAGNVTKVTTVSSTLASSIVHYNMIGVIWETFSYEISLAVAVIVFAATCAIEIFAWLLIRRLYAQRLTNTEPSGKDFSDSSAKKRTRRRYNSGETSV